MGAHGSPARCPCVTRKVFVGRPRRVSGDTHGLVVGHQRGKCTWGARVVHVRHPWGFRGVYMERPRIVRGTSEGRPWIAPELSMGHLRGIRGAPIGRSWGVRTSVGCMLGAHGSPAGCQCIPWCVYVGHP